MRSPFETAMGYLFRQGKRVVFPLVRDAVVDEFLRSEEGPPPPESPRRSRARSRTRHAPAPSPAPFPRALVAKLSKVRRWDHLRATARVVGSEPYPSEEPPCACRGPGGETCILPLTHDRRLCHRDDRGTEWSGGGR